ncbi:DUF3667 domain-containing protein [Pseudoxanthomonas sp. PXM01]|uniref:DUF3667 domain-containing protein n=1 Tax=Pseudoxanthomonas sp. PXM01 TaxID=2769295 RepID=UPI0017870A15|nr:DUF3667 domain-containing protein [Pseudoxanthomonas sp. PXM01]MBD9470006.1 DUF3667 domain-containing protein [Pseudoxanthomonas sp. PXM01]
MRRFAAMGMAMSDTGKCANCVRAIDGHEQKFCPACGQPTPAHRIDWHFLGHELEHSVLHMDRGILYSLKELMLRPGHLMRAYLEGRRANQVKPLLLLMISAAAVVVLGKYLLGGDLVGSAMQAGYSQGRAMGGGDVADPAVVTNTFAMVRDWINGHLTAFTLLCLPLEAAAFRLAFRGRGLNYPEWLVVSAFLTVQTFVFMAVAVSVQRWVPNVQAWILPVVFVYAVFSLIQLFQHHSRWATAFRALAGLVMFVLAQSLFTALIVAVLLVASGLR